MWCYECHTVSVAETFLYKPSSSVWPYSKRIPQRATDGVRYILQSCMSPVCEKSFYGTI